MSTDFRALCAELTDELSGYASANPHHDSDALVIRARAALASPGSGLPQRPENFEFALDFLGRPENDELLAYVEQLEARSALMADGPAVPEGREPASVVGEPSDEELLELMPETMRDEFAHAASVCSDMTGGRVKPGIFRVCLNTATLEYARALLARWGHQPAPPAEGEVGELVAKLRRLAPQNPLGSADPTLTRAADLLAQRHPEPVPALPEDATVIEPSERTILVPIPAPVPVAERLPGPEDCAPWPKDSDASAWCWMGKEVDGGWEWEQRSAGYLVAFPGDFTHWLPAHALPLPAGEVGHG